MFKILSINYKFSFFFSSKKYLTQKNVVEKVSANLTQGKVGFIFFILCQFASYFNEMHFHLKCHSETFPNWQFKSDPELFFSPLLRRGHLIDLFTATVF